MWETAFDVTDKNSFDCNVNRSKGDTSTQMYLINHFLDKLLLGQPTPDTDALNVTNSASGTGSLQAQVDACSSQYTKPPTFMLLDVSTDAVFCDVFLMGRFSTMSMRVPLRLK
jgi:hypothetical protein